MRTLSPLISALAVALALLAATRTNAAEEAASAAKPQTATSEDGADTGMTMEQFLDRLMRAESGGRLNARNSLSTAAGPYQFIASTWLLLASRHFGKDTKDLPVDQILALRMDAELSRHAADIYTQENAVHLVAQGQTATFQNLRLAFLVGAGGAVRVLAAHPQTPVRQLLGAGVIAANPFMARLTAEGLIARAAHDIAATSNATAGLTPDPSLVNKARGTAAAERPRIAAPCNLALPSCRRWLALAENRAKKQRRASR